MKYFTYTKLLFFFLIGIVYTGCSHSKSTDENVSEEITTEAAPEEDYNKYNSYDLAFFDLHGDVKSFSQDYVDFENYPYTSEFIEKTLFFNEDGNWTNRPSEFIKDSEGKIVEWDQEIMDGDGFTYFKWENGRLKDDLRPGRVYSKEGWVLIEPGSWDESVWINVYTDYIVDVKGNWIQRTVHSFPIQYWDSSNGEYLSGLVKGLIKIGKDDVRLQHRNIKYHSNNNTKRPDEDSQTQVMSKLKEMSKKENISEKEYNDLLKEYGLK